MNKEAFVRELQQQVTGEVYSDRNTLGMYATDASVYQIFPLAVIVPKTEADVVLAHKMAFAHGVSILPRGAGTSLAGQTVGESLVIDFNKYLNKILDLDVENKSIRVEPGIIHSELNEYLKPYGLLYGPDPATSSRANIGGIVANNSSGSRSIVFGKAIDHIIEMRVVLADGTIVKFEDLSAKEIQKKIQIQTKEASIYRTLASIIEEDKDLIEEKFPKVMRRVSGYSLDEFVDDTAWNLGKLICGSEGTLATILDVKLNLVDLPKKRGACVIHYRDRMTAIGEVKNLLDFKPSAVELLDDNVIGIALRNPSTREIAGFIEGKPGAILIVEFFGDTKELVNAKYQALKKYLKSEKYSYAYPFYEEGQSYNNIWEVRKKGLGLLLSIKTAAKPIPFIEDACVPVASLAEYIGEVMAFCDQLKVKVILYAHASVGVLHVRPVLDLRKKEDIEKFEKISRHTLDLVIKYKGSWSGEHGDGFSRSYGIPQFYGNKIYGDFKKIKTAFDPKGLMNPGKIVHPFPLTGNLRYGEDYKDQSIETIYHYRKEEGFESLVHMCNGIGVCQRVSGGVMCPSYKASLDEKDSTRGRANVLRLTLSKQLNQGDFTADELLDVLDLCISCKSCKTECPSNVDMAKLKSEILQKKYDKKGYGLRELFIILSDDFSKWLSGPLAGVFNWGIKTKVFRYCLQLIAKIDARRILPAYASLSLKKWYRKKFKPTGTGKQVVLFADTYINYHEPRIGIAIIKLLDKMNFRVKLVDTGGSKRPLISNGFLRKAKKKGEKIIKILNPFLTESIPVIVCEPGAFSAFAEDIPDLIDDEKAAEKLRKGVVSLERFIAGLIKKGAMNGRLTSSLNHHVLHGHCHQKATDGMEPLETIFKHVGGSFEILDAGCCGMAGAFGFEKEHYDFSKKIFDGDLGKKLKAIPENIPILASGFSCRHQISELGDRELKHWVEVLDFQV